ncbi:MAG: hypothetical protein IJM56_01880 [Clostridia bacterium]|nr:hypothetical protein [Clostridia bacterium]
MMEFFSELFSGDAVIIVCLVFGAALLVLEALTPGMGLPGAAGVVFVAIGTALMWVRHGSTAGLISLLAALVFMAGAVVLSLKSAAKGRLSKSKIVLNAETGAQPIDSLAYLVNKTGRALTVLNPVGDAEIDGKKLDVLSDGGYIDKGATLRVVRTEGKKIIVRRQED